MTPAKKATPKRAKAKKATSKKAASKKSAPKKSASAQPSASAEPSASQRIDARIAELGDWRGEALARMRALIHEADPSVVETWKWMGTPIWEHDGIICTGESYKDKIKLTFAKGASLTDPSGLFNSSLDGGVRRALDIFEGKPVNAAAFKALVKEAIALNTAKQKKPTSRRA